MWAVVAAGTLAGCSAAGGGAWLVTVAVLLLVGACTEDRTRTLGGGVDVPVTTVDGDGTPRPDLGDGTWEPCCEDGQITTCFCPAGAECNYGRGLDQCGTDGGRDATVDAAPDTGDGTWQTCCVDGRIDTCFCPAGVACNYGMGLQDCGDGTCAQFPDTCEGGDAG
jgi:hypothetical protein